MSKSIEQKIEEAAIEHANRVSDPEWPDFHGRYSSFKQALTSPLAKEEGFKIAVQYLRDCNEIIQLRGLIQHGKEIGILTDSGDKE